MEATGEDLTLLHKILPPRLEDAGLENCALPPLSIQEAFLKAASAVGCVGGVDPAIDDSPPSDVLVGVKPESSPPGPCATVKGDDLVKGGDGGGDVVFGGGGIEGDSEKKSDVVVVGESGGGGGEESGDCMGGLKDGLKERENDDDEDEDDDKKKPTLVEGFFFNP